MMLKYLVGDCIYPEVEGEKIIVHVCNDEGKWGRGFVLSISRRWSKPESTYRKMYKQQGLRLSEVQFVRVEHDIIVANLVGQRGIAGSSVKSNQPPIRYDALAEGLVKVADKAIELNATVHMPRIGCGLAGGDWTIVQALINTILGDRGIRVYVYDLPCTR